MLGELDANLLEAYLESIKQTGTGVMYYSLEYGSFELTQELIERVLKGLEHEEKGEQLFYAGNYNQALTEFITALKYIPHDWILYMGIGNCYGMMGDFVRAEKYMNEAKLIPGADVARIERNLQDMKANLN